MRRGTDGQLLIGMAVLAGLMGISSAIGFRNARQIHISSGWVAHAHETMGTLDNLLSNIKDDETGQRGFIITADLHYLKPYEDALARIDDNVKSFQALTRDDARQAARLPRLKELIQLKLDEVVRTITLRKERGFDAAQKEVLTHLGRNRMDDLRGFIGDMRREEENQLRDCQAATDRAYVVSVVTRFITTSLAIGTVILFWWLLRRHLHDRQVAAALLRNEREWFHTTLASIGDAVIATDNAGRVSFLNAVAEELTGWTGADAFGRPLEEVFRIVNDQTRKPVDNPALRALKEGRVVGLANHTVLIAKTGQEFPIDDSAAPIRDPSGNVVGVVLVFRDVTARRQSEAELQLNEARVRSLVDNIVDGIITINEQGVVQSYNSAAERLFGYAGSEMIGRNVKMLMPDPYQSEHDGYLSNYRRTGQAKIIGIGREVVGRRKDASTFPMDLAVSTFQVGSERFFTGIVRDITARRQLEAEQKQTEEALRESDRLKNEFLAMLAHELRNPLAPIVNALCLIQGQGYERSKNLRELWAIMDRQVEFMIRLVDDLLDVSRISRGKIKLVMAPVEVATIVARAVETSRPLIDSRQHKLDVLLPDESIIVNADTTRMSQILLNVLNNAAKYTPVGGHIRLTVERKDGEVEFRVRDNGMGIRAQMLPKIFDLFSQSDRTLDRAEGGLGIGLTLVRRLTEMHNGTVTAHSDGLGLGTEVIIRLPILREWTPISAPVQKLSSPPRPAPSKRHRVLVVDDNRDSAETLAMLLKLRGMDVRTAHNGPQALLAADAHRPDLVLLDIGLPEMDGYEVARRLRSQPQHSGAVLVALTGYGMEEDRRKSQEAGFNDHIVKPVGIETLEHLVGSLSAV